MICTAFWVGWGLNFNVKLFYYLDRIIYNIYVGPGLGSCCMVCKVSFEHCTTI